MTRWLGGSCGAASLLGRAAVAAFVGMAAPAHAAGMDLAPEGLVLQPAGAVSACQAAVNPGAASPPPCRPDNVAFRNLASELGFALAPPGMRPARAPGFTGFALTASVAATAIHAGGTSRADDGTTTAYWRAGTRGGAPAPLVSVYALRLEKGLPLGFTVAATVGYLGGTSTEVVGGDFRWALLEGFDDRRRDGVLAKVPDLSVGVGASTLLGAAPVSLTTLGVDVTLSKPFLVVGALVITPSLGYQRLVVFARADGVDATPAVDALAACGYQGRQPETGAPVCATGRAGDFANDLVFDAVRTYRHRGSLGLSLRHGHLTAGAQWVFDVAQPSGENPGLDSTRQWTTSIDGGIVF